ncbi:hypothetical protein ACK8OR_17665 [Jannaschia sp. KMU-145]|uniref:hypothetical protein n=1 Tax=Jannaschia halovivens TaxID=3388667 RepID=UPI00396B15C3
MKPVLASTAIAWAAFGVAGAHAQVAANPAFVAGYDSPALRASMLDDMAIYASETRIDPSASLPPGLERLGEVDDIVLGPNGGVDAVIADIGGFLGIGDREVAFDIDQLVMVPAAEGSDEMVLVVMAARDEIENAPMFENTATGSRTDGARAITNEGSGVTTAASASVVTVETGSTASPRSDGAMEGTDTDTATLDAGTVVANPQTPATAIVTGSGVQTTAPGTDLGEGDAEMASGASSDTPPVTYIPGVEFENEAPAVARDGYTPRMQNTLTLPELEGVPVFDVTEEEIGVISYAFSPGTRSSDVTVVVVSIGGFLGIGDHEVAMHAKRMSFLDGESGIRAYVDATRDQLEALPEYDD